MTFDIPDYLTAVEERLHLLQAEQSIACGGTGYDPTPPTRALQTLAKGPERGDLPTATWARGDWLYATAMDAPARATQQGSILAQYRFQPFYVLYAVASWLLDSIYLVGVDDDDPWRLVIAHIMSTFSLPEYEPVPDAPVGHDAPLARLLRPGMWPALPKRALTLYNDHHVRRVAALFAAWKARAMARRAEVAELAVYRAQHAG